jgi:hypothetical protein
MFGVVRLFDAAPCKIRLSAPCPASEFVGQEQQKVLLSPSEGAALSPRLIDQYDNNLLHSGYVSGWDHQWLCRFVPTSDVIARNANYPSKCTAFDAIVTFCS